MHAENKKMVLLASTSFLLAFLLASSSILDFNDDVVVLNITTEEDWQVNSGVGWSDESLAFEEGRMHIIDYGTSEYMIEHETHLLYRTRLHNRFDDEYELDAIRLEGYMAEDYDSGVGITVLDCSSSAEPDYLLSAQRYCHSGFEEYKTGVIEESGEFTITRDLEGIKIEGYPVVHIDLVANQSETPDEAVENIHVNSVLLTRQ